MKYLILLLLISCTSKGLQPETGYKRRDLNRSYIGAGVEKYFMPSFPDWVNISPVGECARDTMPRFLDLRKLNQDHKVDYVKLVNLQAVYNESFVAKSSAEINRSKLGEQTEHFYNSFDKIRGGALSFKPHDFKKVNIYWVDPAINSKSKRQQLVAETKKPSYLNAPPVFVSSCLTEKSMAAFLKKSGVDIEPAKFLGAHFFSIFDGKLVQKNSFVLDIQQVFNDKEISVYSSEDKVRDILLGKYKYIKY